MVQLRMAAQKEVYLDNLSVLKSEFMACLAAQGLM